MAIPIDEGTLLTLSGLIFIPVFIFCIKMIIEMGNTKNKLTIMDDHIKDSSKYYDRIEELTRRNTVNDLRLTNLDKDIEQLRDNIRHLSTHRGGSPFRKGRGSDDNNGGGDRQ